MSALTEAERDSLIVALHDFPHAGSRWITFRTGVYVATERIVAAREAAAREAVLAEVEALAREFIPPYNCELRYDGTEDPSIAAWVEDRSEVVDRLHALVARLRADA